MARPITWVTNMHRDAVVLAQVRVDLGPAQSRLEWHMGQATTMASAPRFTASSTSLPLSLATMSVRVTQKAAPQHSVLKVQSTGVGAHQRPSAGPCSGDPRRGRSSRPWAGRTSRQP